MRIVFFNVWYGQVGQPLQAFMAEQAKTTDVFCLQEANDAAKRLLQDTLSGYTKFSAYKPAVSPAFDGYFLETYVRNSLEVPYWQPILEQGTDCGFGLYTGIRYQDQDIHLVNVHGITEPGDNKLDRPGRLRQSQALIDLLKDKPGIRIIGGDFNIEPETDSIRMFEQQGYVDAIKRYGIKTTRNLLAWNQYPQRMYYSDYAFVQQGVAISKFEVIDNEVSDHLPLILELGL